MTLEVAAGSGLKGLEGNPWRGAEAYHFCLLAHQQLYAGQVSAGPGVAIGAFQPCGTECPVRCAPMLWSFALEPTWCAAGAPD